MLDFRPMQWKRTGLGKSIIMKKSLKELEATRAHMRLHTSMNHVNCNTKIQLGNLRTQPSHRNPSRCDIVQRPRIIDSAPQENMPISSRPTQFNAMVRLVHKETNVNRENKYNAFPSRVKEGSNPNQSHPSVVVKDCVKNLDYKNGKEFSPCIFGKDLSNNPRNSSSMDDNKCRSIFTNYKSGNMGQGVNCSGKTNNGNRRRETLLDEVVQEDNKKICRQMKKLKCHNVVYEGDNDEANKRIEDPNHKHFEDGTSRWMSKVAEVSIPLHIKKQSYCCSKPIDEPTWSGIFKIGQKYVSLAGHLSTKYSEEVWKLSRSLMPVVKVTKLSRSKCWPKVWEASKPNGDNIGLYFFQHEMTPNEELDELLQEVMDNDLALRATIGEAEMLIFSSILLPEQYKTFKGKHYLWGVFKPREHKSVAVAERLNTTRCAQEVLDPVHQDKVQCEARDLPDRIAYEVQATNVQSTTNMGFKPKDHEVGKQGDALHHTMFNGEAVVNATNGGTLHANQGQIDPSRGFPLGKVFVGFVIGQTPRLLQLIQEMEHEGGVVIAMQGEMR